MIHEVMVLDHCGVDLAYIQYGSAVKLWALGGVVVSMLAPRTGFWLADLGIGLGGMACVGNRHGRSGIGDGPSASRARAPAPRSGNRHVRPCNGAGPGEVKLMTTWVEGFLVILMLTNLWLLGSSRLLSCIAAVSVQGVLLGLLPLVIGIDAPLWRLILQAGISIGFKGIALPLLLLRAVALRGRAPRGRALCRLLGFPPDRGRRSRCLPFHRASPADPGGAAPLLLVPAALFTALTGLFIIVSRRSAIVQALGYLAMESGIAAFGLALAEQEPLLIEMGTFLDAFVAVFVMGITIFHISREFDHIDADRLSSLKDSPQ